jgi:trehalose 6-phosphate synthase/phosphatase
LPDGSALVLWVAPGMTPRTIAHLADELARAPALVLLLDYDGTLVPFADVPDHASPDAALLDLLVRLAARPATVVHIVSGRSRDTLERWLGRLPVSLHAEHGFWSRRPGGAWTAAARPDLGWRHRARSILEEFVAGTPGSLIEEKTAGIAWHYRRVEPGLARAQAMAVRRRLREFALHQPVDVLDGEKVIELRPRGIDKGTIVAPALHAAPAHAAILAIGDDHTDEDLFAALPPHAFAVHVGNKNSRAPLRATGWKDTRALLARLAPDPREVTPARATGGEHGAVPAPHPRTPRAR